MPAEILIVDADRQVVDMVARTLRRNGHSVHTAPDGPRALVHLAKSPVHLVMTDITMPVVAGRTLLHTLREEGIATPMVLVTDVPYTASDLPGVYFLRKPFTIPQLFGVVDEVLATHRRPRFPADKAAHWHHFYGE